ncbi:MAG TPA: exodeoxyribonuclease V subunit gamma [Bacteroidota bacterium]|nr:exodeoxyribonuclease V subunit gamma [Bacteroidota bacterium]
MQAQTGSLTVFTHFDLKILATHFADDIRTRPAGMDPISKEFLIVQTPGMKKFLELECAQRNTIFTQVAALAPKQFVMELGYLLLKLKEKRSVFERDILPWAIYRLMKQGIEQRVPELSELSTYGGSENSEMRLFSLAEKTADIFDQYMLYRPDWIGAWESDRCMFDTAGAHDKNEVWQKYLWTTLVREAEVVSPAKYITTLSDALANPTQELISRLPKRIFLFGMSILPPQYLRIFSKLGELIDVTMYLQVPSIFYFGDALSDKQIQWRRRSAAGSETTANATIVSARSSDHIADEVLDDAASTNALLRNLGKMGREFMDLLLETNAQQRELYDIADIADEPARSLSLLHRTQWDVLMCNDAALEPIACNEDTWSIRLAACYGPLREVEVVHDLLLDCFSENPSLTPADVLIVTPDIELYGPIVQMVFGDARQRCGARIPFSLSDQSMLAENKIAQFAQDLLSAATGRFEVSAILPLFESASDLSGMPLSMKERELIRRWCEQSGIRWGFDDGFKEAHGLPPSDLFTWRYGIDRLIAGYVMDDESKLESGLFPAVEVEGDGAHLLGRLAEFVDSLAALTAVSREKHTIHEWNETIAPLISRFFSSEDELQDDGKDAAAAFSRALSALRERTEISRTHAERFPFAIYMQTIVDELSQSAGGRGFFTGNVSVAGMIPMRSIPFKIVVMMGMNRGKFPRHSTRPLFDLMSQDHPKPGDRDSLTGDRYIFLETILSAKERLIITWNGFDSSASSEIPPSVLVDEFTSYLTREYCIEGSAKNTGKAITVRYPLHPFSGRYQSNDPADVMLNTWNVNWFDPSGKRCAGAPIFLWNNRLDASTADDAVNGNAIYNALADPMSCFLGACRIQAPAYKESLESCEPFAITGLDKWALKKAIIAAEFGNDPDAIERLAANGGVPPGTAGRIAVEGVKSEIRTRIELIRAIDSEPRFEFHRIDCAHDGCRYRMEIDSVSMKGTDMRKNNSVSMQGNDNPKMKIAAVKKAKRTVKHDDATTGRIAVLADLNKTDGKRSLRAWMTHLFLNLEMPTETKFILLDETIVLPAIAKDQAAAHIRSLDCLTNDMQQKLLPFIPDVSLEYLLAEKKGDDPCDKAWKKLSELFGRVYHMEYKLDRRIRDAFDDAEDWDTAMGKIPGGQEAFAEMARTIYGPFLDAKGEN